MLKVKIEKKNYKLKKMIKKPQANPNKSSKVRSISQTYNP